MPTVSIVLSIVSLLTLVLGILAWRLTTSRPLLINVLLSTAFTLIRAYAATNRQRPEFAYILPFFSAMLCGGKALGYLWRSRKESELLTPGSLLAFVGLACAGGAFFAFRVLY